MPGVLHENMVDKRGLKLRRTHVTSIVYSSGLIYTPTRSSIVGSCIRCFMTSEVVIVVTKLTKIMTTQREPPMSLTSSFFCGFHFRHLRLRRMRQMPRLNVQSVLRAEPQLFTPDRTATMTVSDCAVEITQCLSTYRMYLLGG